MSPSALPATGFNGAELAGVGLAICVIGLLLVRLTARNRRGRKVVDRHLGTDMFDR